MFRAPSWSGLRNWERANTKIKWEETGERKGGRPLAPLLPDHGLFFHLPFNCASSLLSESLFQALLLQTVKTFPDAKDILLLLLFIIQSQYSIGHVYMSAYLPCIFEWNHINYNKKKWNPVNTDTDGTCHSVRIERINFRESIWVFCSAGKTETVRYIQESVLSECT